MTLDIQSILFFLGISNLFIALHFILYSKLRKTEKRYLISFSTGKLLQAFAFFIFWTDNLPHYISNIGVVSLVLGFIYEISSIVTFDKKFQKRTKFVLIIPAAIISFITLFFPHAQDFQLALIASISAIYIFCFAGIHLVNRVHESKYMWYVGVSYLAFVIFWSYYAFKLFFLKTDFVFLSNQNTFHILLSIAACLITLLGSIGFLLILKEQDEKTIIKDNKKLQNLIETKDKLYSIIAHDLRSPLGSLVQVAEILWEQQDEIEKPKREFYLDAVKENSTRTFGLLDNLLQWTRSENGALKLEPKELDIRTIVNDNIKLLESIISNKKITVYNQIEEGIQVYADHKMMDTVIRNLLSNGIKFTEEGGDIVFQAKRKNIGEVIIIIKDTGKGIKKEMLPSIFDMKTFYTTPGTKNEKGTGLGLKLCKEFITRNKGTIRVESLENKGTGFFISLPARKKDSADISLPKRKRVLKIAMF